MSRENVRIGVDVGGTFTDAVLEKGGRQYTAKTSTTPDAPEEAIVTGISEVLKLAGCSAEDVKVVIHGTTLATNLLIERKGAMTALLTTEGFRDTIEMRTEGRYDQYDTSIMLPQPLVPRRLRLAISERMAASGRILKPLDEAGIEHAIETLRSENIESVAIGFLHSYRNPEHEQRAAQIVRAALPAVSISLSSEVSPEMREFERLVTACANAYLQPRIAGYLNRLGQALCGIGLDCPLFLMHSGGGYTTVDTAIRFPVRLLESGPAGGAIFSADIASRYGFNQVMSFDMGGTTAKICLIDNGTPQTTRLFEAAREYRFKRGSGLPIRIPMIEMVEIGTGGGSIAAIDSLGKVQVGPLSAGSQPGPASYGRGGTEPTVTDADVALGRIDPLAFGGGLLRLDADAGTAALSKRLGSVLGMSAIHSAFAVSEMADEDMANAARVHAIEHGKDIGDRVMIAFGGAAPLHAARIAQKLGIRRVLIPVGASVGSAVGFLRAPVTYELVRSSYHRLSSFNHDEVAAVFAAMSAEARGIVHKASPDAPVTEDWTAFMRYVGQGFEVAVPIRAGDLGEGAGERLAEAFAETYRSHFTWVVPGADIEVLSWTVRVSAGQAAWSGQTGGETTVSAEPVGSRRVFDPDEGEFLDFSIYRREHLSPGARFSGPALIEESQTTTVVAPRFDGQIDAAGTIVMDLRESATGEGKSRDATKGEAA